MVAAWPHCRFSRASRARSHCRSQLAGSVGQRCSTPGQGRLRSRARRACTAAVSCRAGGNWLRRASANGPCCWASRAVASRASGLAGQRRVSSSRAASAVLWSSALPLSRAWASSSCSAAVGGVEPRHWRAAWPSPSCARPPLRACRSAGRRGGLVWRQAWRSSGSAPGQRGPQRARCRAALLSTAAARAAGWAGKRVSSCCRRRGVLRPRA